MKTHLPSFRAFLATAVVAALLAFAFTDNLRAQAPSPTKPAPATAPVDPATHAAHAAAGTHPTATPAQAGKGDPALTQQVAQLQAKIAQLEAALAKAAPHPTTPAGSTGAAMPPSPAMSGGGTKTGGGQMGRMPAGGSMPGMSGAGGAPSMMGMMDKMMGMMDKMMSMGGGAAAPAGGMGGGMGMDDDKMEMGGMGSGGAMPGAPPASGMTGGGMGMGDDKMEMAEMMGMAGGGSMPQSALPGFPGASHLYHIGATGFFLDHPQHIALTTDQQAALNQAKEQALLAKSSADRAIEQAEQELWTLTAADQPDAAKCEAKIREIEKLRGDQRLGFIRAVGEASKLLTDDQRKSLTGFAPPAPAMPAGGMNDM